MKTAEANARTRNTLESLKELSESYADFAANMKGFSEELSAVGKLWRASHKSRLIKLGLTIVFFPEPTPVSETVGACLIAAGAVQQGIRSRTLYIDDVPKICAKALRDICTISRETPV
jgi:hypothetical protein